MLFSWLLGHINKKTNPGGDVDSSIGVLDIYGFENFDSGNGFEQVRLQLHCCLTFSQLCINYTNEKLHAFFNSICFDLAQVLIAHGMRLLTLHQKMYTEEGIDATLVTWTDNTGRLDLMDKPPKSIYNLLDSACLLPDSSDADFVLVRV